MGKVKVPWFKIGVFVTVVVVIVMISVPIAFKYFSGQDIGLPDNGGGDDNDNLIALRLPWRFSVVDKYAGGGVNCSVSIYDGQLLLETVTVTNGKGDSNTEFMSGEKYNLKIWGTGFVTYWITDVEVPYETTDQATYHYTPLQIVDLGTFSVSIEDQNGNIISDGGNYNKTASGSVMTFNIFVRNTEADSGWISSYDILEGYWDKAIFFVKFTGTNAENIVVTSSGYHYKEVGDDRYFIQEIPDEGIVRDQQPDGTYDPTGIWSTSISIDLSSYSGDAADMVYGIVIYTSWEYFNYYGAFGTDSSMTYATVNLVD